MATPTYDLLESVTLASAAADVTFSGISATGKGDLVLAIDALGTSGNSVVLFQFNSDTGSNYNLVSMLGNVGGGIASYSNTGQTSGGSETNIGTTARANFSFQIQDFSATDKHKSVLIRGARADNTTSASAARWASTAAITSIKLFLTSASYAAGSTFNLYQLVSE